MPECERHGEDFAGTIDEVLRLGWSGHYSAGQSVLLAVLETRATSTGQRSLCRALLALLSVALDDTHAARRLARQAISDSARPTVATSALELRSIRLARALAVKATQLIGDNVRGRRAAQARFMTGDADSAWIIDAHGNRPWSDAPGTVRRYVRFVAAIDDRCASRRNPGPLTVTEVAILKLLAAGSNAVRVAGTLGRSPHTVRTHVRNAYMKLGAHGREDALVKAKILGLLNAEAQHTDQPSALAVARKRELR